MKMRILLTASARSFAEERGWLDRLERIEIGGSVQTGDRIALGDEARHDFQVLRRRILASGSEPVLEVTLDFPARG